MSICTVWRYPIKEIRTSQRYFPGMYLWKMASKVLNAPDSMSTRSPSWKAVIQPPAFHCSTRELISTTRESGNGNGSLWAGRRYLNPRLHRISGHSLELGSARTKVYPGNKGSILFHIWGYLVRMKLRWGPKVGKELVNAGIMAVIFSLLGIYSLILGIKTEKKIFFQMKNIPTGWKILQSSHK